MYKNLLLPVLLVLCSFAAKAQVDSTIGITAPGSATKDYKELSHYLCDGLTVDRAKANAIYNWITHNIKYDVKALQKDNIKTPKVEKVLKSRKGLCEGYAILFTEMCREAGLKAVNVDGYAKDWIFDNGDKMYIPRHQWCAVMIDGQWELADPTWGAGGLVQAPGPIRRVLNKITRNKVMYAKKMKFKFKYNPDYFLQDPATFKLKHLPTDPLWQLADTVMPLQVFETGDSAVNKFNTYCKAKKNNPELEKISALSEMDKNFDMADRAYKFNNRYPVILAIKHTYRATSDVEKVFTDSTVHDSKILMTDAVNSLRKSEEYIKDQKKAFPDEYNKLKKKNKTKNQEAKQDIRKIKTDDKRLLAEEKKYVHATKTKGDRLKKKALAAHKREQAIDPDKINEVVTGKTEKKESSPEIHTLADTIAGRKMQIKDIEAAIAIQDTRIEILEADNSKRLDSMAYYLGYADSILVRETISRLGMNDNYDDEVIQYSGSFKDYKYRKADTIQKYYQVYFDTIATVHDTRQKLQIAEMDVYKKNLKSMEQYKKWNSTNMSIRDDYKETANAYLDCITSYNNNLATYLNYLKSNKKLFDGLSKVDKKEIKLTEYMEKAENMRKVLEEKTLTKKQSMDMNENKRQEATVKNIKKKVDKIASQIN